MTSGGNAVLSLGMHPSAIDYSRYPGVTEELLTERIEAGEAVLRDPGSTSCPAA